MLNLGFFLRFFF